MVPPGFSSPDASAASTIFSAIRSFTEPPGLRYSTFARMVAAMPSVTLLSLTRGVFPTRSAMCSAYFTRPPSQIVDVGRERALVRRLPTCWSEPVDIPEALDLTGAHSRAVLATTRRDGRPQLSPVDVVVDAGG